jgi:hypothetical protein
MNRPIAQQCSTRKSQIICSNRLETEIETEAIINIGPSSGLPPVPDPDCNKDAQV